MAGMPLISSSQEAGMGYDPFVRGSAAVGVTTIELQEPSLGRASVPMEVWYPAKEAYRGCDFDDANRDRFRIAPGLPETAQHAVRNATAAPDVFPLFMYFHGGYGDRRKYTYLCTHLASHGYLVAAASFPGDSITDLMSSGDGSQATVAQTPIDESAKKRPAQASAFIEQILSITLPTGVRIDQDRIGTGGFSMGGYTALAVNSINRRPSATFAMCPMYGERSLVPQVRRLQALLRVDNWVHPVATFVLSGELDPMVNANDMRTLYQELTAPKRLALMGRAGHLHWADGAKAAHER
jgi:dienelactone hydrolase